MPSAFKATKASSSNHNSKPSKAALVKPPLVKSSSEAEEDEDESDDEGVDEEGMERLMKALGTDALDEFEQAHLQALAGEDDEEWETDEEMDGKAGEGAEEDAEQDEENGSGEDLEGSKAIEGPSDDEEEQEGDIALDDVDGSVDEDAVPQQKIEIDNKVRGLPTGIVPFVTEHNS